MRNVLFIIFIISLSSCNLIYLGQQENEYSCECPSFESLGDAANFCYNAIRSARDMDQYGKTEYWAAPDETLRSMKGDCEDRAILFAYIARTQFGDDPLLIWEAKAFEWHMYVFADNRKYFNVAESGWDDFKTYKYEQAIWIATHTHGEGPLGKNTTDQGL